LTTLVRTAIERGPKGKKTVAFAIDWPGWNRGGKDDAAALAAFETYRDRYRPVAHRAGFGDEYDSLGEIDIVEEYEGTGSTDFWGISFAPSTADREPMSPDVLERRLKLLWACWEYFDDVGERVSPEMKKGPRGGGRSRDEIINHVLGCERGDFAVKVGVSYPPGLILDPVVRREYREEYAEAIRAYNAESRKARTWELAFLLRHSAYHTMDHAWEMEDKDLTGESDA
jgi:hypothetical protein